MKPVPSMNSFRDPSKPRTIRYSFWFHPASHQLDATCLPLLCYLRADPPLNLPFLCRWSAIGNCWSSLHRKSATTVGSASTYSLLNSLSMLALDSSFPSDHRNNIRTLPSIADGNILCSALFHQVIGITLELLIQWPMTCYTAGLLICLWTIEPVEPSLSHWTILNHWTIQSSSSKLIHSSVDICHVSAFDLLAGPLCLPSDLSPDLVLHLLSTTWHILTHSEPT